MNQPTIGTGVFVALGLALLAACGDATAKLPAPSAEVVQQCQTVAERIAFCSHGMLAASPNDGTNCAVVVAEGGTQCAAAFDNFAYCVTGSPCLALNEGSCLVDYSATAGFCGGILAPKAQPWIGAGSIN